MKRWITTVAVGILSVSAFGAPVSQEEALERALNWMAGDPIMAEASQIVDSVTTFPDTGGYSVYIVELDPKGYIVLNSDDSLPFIIAYSPKSPVDLSDDLNNAFRAMLINHCERTEETLANPVLLQSLSVGDVSIDAVTELYGPFLDTEWDQCNPYNLLCPDDPSPATGYDGRVAAGCVPVAYAQVMNFYQWPYYGWGSHSYTDSEDAITGSHSADFTDTYDWSSMLDSYNWWNTSIGAAENAIAELMYELGVAAEANYESNGTGSSPVDLGNRLSENLFYEPINHHFESQAELIDPLEADLRAGYPCTVSIPGHSIVADGLKVDSGVTTYHICYGWGGSNDGWYSANTVPNGALDGGSTSIRPRLVALPMSNTVYGAAGGSAEQQWVLPELRTNEIAQLAVKQLAQQSGSWSSGATEITCQNSGWEVIPDGYSGSCWYAKTNDLASIILDEVFVPSSSSQLSFRRCARISHSIFSVEVSVDGGTTYTTIASVPEAPDTNIYEYNWTLQNISLSAYAGQQIRIKFSLSESNWAYSGEWNGVRVDSLSITSSDWYDWEPYITDTTLATKSVGGQTVFYTTLTNLPAGTHMLATTLTDTDGVEHAMGPLFTLDAGDDGDGMPTDWENLYGLDTNVDDGGLDPDNDGYSNLQEYICDTVPTNGASCWLLSVGADSLPAFYGASGRVYNIDYRVALNDSNDWLPLTSGIVGADAVIDVSSYEAVTNDFRFYRVEVQLAP